MHAIGIDIGGTKIAGARRRRVRRDPARRPACRRDAADPAAIVTAVVDHDRRGWPRARTSRPPASRPPASSTRAQSDRLLRAEHQLAQRAVPRSSSRSGSTCRVIDRERRERRRMGRVPVRRGPPVPRHGDAHHRHGRRAARSSADDRLLRGGFGAAGEIGHLRVVPGGLPCGCGARGCIEQYGSGRALQRMANEIADAGGIGQPLAEARAANGGRSTAHDRQRAHRRRTTRARSPPSASSATGSARPARALGAVLDPQLLRVRRRRRARPASCCSSPSAQRTSTTSRPAASTRSPSSRSPSSCNDAGVVGRRGPRPTHSATALRGRPP